MERDNWNNRRNYNNEYNNDRDQSRGNRNRVDEDSYRGAYRFDTSSDHRNETTWDGFHRNDRDRDRNRNQNSDYGRNSGSDNNSRGNDRNVYENYYRDYNSNQQGRGSTLLRDEDYDRDRRYQQDDRNGNTRNRDEQYQSTSGGYGTRFGGNSGGNFGGYERGDRNDRDNRYERHDSVRSRIDESDQSGWGNFNSDYSPDNYGSRRRGINDGNMAGSLSYGYDGDRNSDPDWDRNYDPLSGERRSYHGNYQSRHPERGQYRGATSRNRHGENDSDWF